MGLWTALLASWGHLAAGPVATRGLPLGVHRHSLEGDAADRWPKQEAQFTYPAAAPSSAAGDALSDVCLARPRPCLLVSPSLWPVSTGNICGQTSHHFRLMSILFHVRW